MDQRLVGDVPRQDRPVIVVLALAIGIIAATCACGDSSTAPQVFPDLSGTWTGNLSVKILTGAVPPSLICIHQWTISSSTGGHIAGSWQSTPDLSLPFLAVSDCRQSGPLTGTISLSGALNLSFDAILAATGCAAGATDVLSGALGSGTISASSQDTITCRGSSNEPRSLTLSMYRQ